MMNYSDLVKMMFSREAQAVGDTEELFLLYIGFYYRGLGEYVEREEGADGNVRLNVKDGCMDTPLGKILAGDIVQHRVSFEKAIAECRKREWEYASELCDFAQAVCHCVQSSLGILGNTGCSALFSVMSCIYAVVCSDYRYFSDQVSRAVRHLYSGIFFNAASLREALVLQAIADEVVSSNRNVVIEPPFFVSHCLRSLRECVRVLLEVLVKLREEDYGAVVLAYKNGRTVEQNVIAALYFVDGLGVSLPKIDNVDIKGLPSYKLRHEYYKARRDLKQNDAIDRVFCCQRKQSINLYQKEREVLMPYAVVDTMMGLIKRYDKSVILPSSADLREYVMRLSKLKNESIIDFLCPERSVATGIGLFGNFMSTNVLGMKTHVVLQDMEACPVSFSDKRRSGNEESIVQNAMIRPARGGGFGLSP